MAELNRFKRNQDTLVFSDLYPLIPGQCRCGCGTLLSGRRTRWASNNCMDKAVTHFFIIKGVAVVIRQEVKKRDDGICAQCNKRTRKWQADHILPVYQGGGGCDLSNFQTLCKKCHEKKTYNRA